MSIPTSQEGIGNLLRLKGLKNVAGRGRRVAGQLPEFMEQETPDYNFEGIGDKANMPLPDLNGGGVAPESYDVRANQVVVPPQEEEMQEEPGMWTKLGRNIAKYVENQQEQPPAWQTEQGDAISKFKNYAENKQPEQPIISETQPEMNYPKSGAYKDAKWFENNPPEFDPNAIEPQEPGVLSKIGKYLTSDYQGGGITPQMEARNPEMFKNYPEVIARKEEEAKIKEQEQAQAKIDSEKALENPYTTVVYGSSNKVANQPELQAKFKDITGMDYNEEISKKLPEYEKVMADMQDNLNGEMNGYSEQETRLRDKILSNQVTSQDKFLIGMALLMPLLIGGFFGKEAGLGALGGGAQGVSDILQRKSKENLDTEELLANIGSKKSENKLKQAELQFKTLSIPETIRKGLPDDVQEFLKGKKEVVWTDPNDGKEKKGILIKPGLVAMPEFVANKEELKEMRESANDISDALTAVKEVNYLTDDILDISSRMKDKTVVGQGLAAFLSGKSPSFASKNSEMIDYQGRKVNAYIVLEHKIKLLTDAYRQAKGMRALTQSVQDHIEGLFRNPEASFQSHQDTVDQMLYTRDLALDRIGNNAKDKGFAPEFLYEELKPKVKETFNKLNYKEGEKESDKLLGK